MDRVRRKLESDLPELSTYFQTGGLVDSVVNMGMPAPIDIQVSGNNQHAAYEVASEMAAKLRQLNDVSDVLIPQDLDYPGIELNVRREMAARLGLTATDVVDNVVTALTSNGMIAPSYWVDPHSGNNYFLTVQYTNHQLDSMTMEDFKQIPLHAKDNSNTTMLENVADIKMINTPTEVDHYQLFRMIDVYVSPKGEDLGALAGKVQKIIDNTKLPPNIRVEMRGSVMAMHQSFISFGVGLLLAIVLVYLILMAQFASFIDPFIILLAIPSGITGVILFLLITGTTLNVMSLMGVLMMTGIVVSNSILIVDVTRTYREGGMPIREAVALACRVRLRPDPDDLAGDHAGTGPDGAGAGGGQRAVCSAGALHHRRPAGVGGADRLHRSRGVSADPSQGRGTAHTGGAGLRRKIVSACDCSCVAGQVCTARRRRLRLRRSATPYPQTGRCRRLRRRQARRRNWARLPGAVADHRRTLRA